ncbi:hypothetical protein EJ05DRAFT_72071 [Pseudovirgaria hyperparasitica]|uniref:Uncharacterized protein n=1 Tax=Pseudovirgaria hyperparasitica TaxID=470096 RepID=A0A6A6W281_9PEZI|nr:uncharacterized protein EJ05DRAFT_72071 [Pseudovirgaria hyperparasitica]KAF2756665.1 hypothetical protein EJ05DRAFT_72071 [Pseudovirgaria hyperparasitica]
MSLPPTDMEEDEPKYRGSYPDREILVDCVQQVIQLLHEPASFHLTQIICNKKDNDELISWFARHIGKPCPAPELPPYRIGTQPACGHYPNYILGCHPESLMRQKIKTARVQYAKALEESQCHDVRITWTIPPGQDSLTLLDEKESLLAVRQAYNRRYSTIEWNPNSGEVGFNIVLTVDELDSLMKATVKWPITYRANCDWLKLPESSEPEVTEEPPKPAKAPTTREYPGPLPRVEDFLGPPMHQNLKTWRIFPSCSDRSREPHILPAVSDAPTGSHHRYMPGISNEPKGRLEKFIIHDTALSVKLIEMEEQEKKRTANVRTRIRLPPTGAPPNVAPHSLSSVTSVAHFQQLKQAAAAAHQLNSRGTPRPSRGPQGGRQVFGQDPRRQQGLRNAAPPLQRRITTQCVLPRRRQQYRLASQANITELDHTSVSSSDTIAVASGPQHLRDLDFSTARALVRSEAEFEEACTAILPDSPLEIITEEAIAQETLLAGSNQRGPCPPVSGSGAFKKSRLSSIPTATLAPIESKVCDADDEVDSADEVLQDLMDQCDMQAGDSESSAESAMSVFWSPQKKPLAISTSSISSSPSQSRTAHALKRITGGLSPASSLRSCASTALQIMNVARNGRSSTSSCSDEDSPPLSLIDGGKDFLRPSDSYTRLKELMNPSPRKEKVARSLPTTLRRCTTSATRGSENHTYKSLPAEPRLSLATGITVFPVIVSANADTRMQSAAEHSEIRPVVCDFMDGGEINEFTEDARTNRKNSYAPEDSEEYHAPAVRDFAQHPHPLLKRRRSIDTIRRHRNGQVIARDFYWCPTLGDSLRRFFRSRMLELGHGRFKRYASCPR